VGKRPEGWILHGRPMHAPRGPQTTAAGRACSENSDDCCCLRCWLLLLAAAGRSPIDVTFVLLSSHAGALLVDPRALRHPSYDVFDAYSDMLVATVRRWLDSSSRPPVRSPCAWAILKKCVRR
jgi:hypothetical protein